ncbi:MAG: ABC transporter ATP-binding protein [Dehalococcoidia bacterium]|nr:MAG: ABC transporter ATP-binding protein [Dehalococcoidia bacterium]
MEALRVEGLSKDFGGVHALSNVSFSVEVGERLAIIGPNGAGKTTLFNLLNGQLLPTAGWIQFFGQDITTMPTHRRAHLGQGRSFQIISLFLNLTVLDNTLITLHGTKRSRFQMFRPINRYEHLLTRAQEMLTSVALWEKKDEFVKNISYGEQRRLEIALTAASEPKLLLLDEPSSGLTAAEGVDIVTMIRNLGTDITVVVVAHDMDLVFGVADRIMVLHYGQLIADGTPEQIQADSRVKEIYMGIEEGTGNARAS